MRHHWDILVLVVVVAYRFGISTAVEGTTQSYVMTLKAEDLSKQQLTNFKTHLLRSVGLAKRPPRRSIRPIVIPDYLWTIYKLMSNDEEHWADDDQMTESHEHRVVNFNTVRTIIPQEMNNSLPQETLHFDNIRIGEKEQLVRMELRVPVNFSDVPSNSDWRTKFRVNLYYVLNEQLNIRSLIDTKVMNSSPLLTATHWVSFDVTSLLAVRKTTESVVALSVCLTSSSGRFKVLRFSLDRWRSIDLPMLLQYTSDGTVQSRKMRNRRSHRHRGAAATGRKSQRHHHQGKKNTRMKMCQKHSLSIRFEELNWQDWIVAPSGYNAYFCAGWCSYPLIDGQNTTNHAIVQSLINSVDPGVVPKPRCVPTDMSSVSMLYLDVNNRIVIKSYPDMVVEGCGCR